MAVGSTTFDRLWTELGSKVRAVARRVDGTSRDPDRLKDLVSEGMVALWQASQRYDGGRGGELWTYAQHRVRGAMLDHLRGMDTLSRDDRQSVRGGREASPGAFLIRCPLEHAGDVDSGSRPDQLAETSEIVEQFNTLLQGLDERRRHVLVRVLRDGVSTLEVGAEIGVTASRVSQITQDILRDARELLGVGTDPAPVCRRKGAGRKARVLVHEGRALTIPEWSNVTGISMQLLYRRLRAGESAADVLRRPAPTARGVKIAWKGQSMSAGTWAQQIGVKSSAIRARLARGIPVERVLAPGRLPKSGIVLPHDGISLTVPEWSRKLGLRKNLIYARLRAGLSSSEVLAPSVRTSRKNSV